MTSLWDQEAEESSIDLVSKVVMEKMDLFEEGPLVIAENFCISAFENMCKNLMHKSPQYKAIIDSVLPDVIVIDSYIGCPALTDANIPWVWLFSAAPLLAFNDLELPPPWSGIDKVFFTTYRGVYNFTLTPAPHPPPPASDP